jgi:serine/alanine adding enzyme
MSSSSNPGSELKIDLLKSPQIQDRWEELQTYATRGELVPHHRDLRWLKTLDRGLSHSPLLLVAQQESQIVGLLPLAHVHGWLFGQFLVSLPYLNTSGVLADSPAIANQLVERAISLADQMKVRYLELRHEQPIDHPKLGEKLSHKVHMRLNLPESATELWDSFPAKVRNQVRKGEKSQLTIDWGNTSSLPDFYAVFSRNMRDLGTPVYGQRLFEAILTSFGSDAEVAIVRLGQVPIAAALLVHGKGISEVPSASTLREHNSTCANMFLYWKLLERAVERKQKIFDFGRSTLDGNTFKFKKQWGALPEPANWQYYLRSGAATEMRPDNPKYQRMIRLWQRLPVSITRILGPMIVRGIP